MTNENNLTFDEWWEGFLNWVEVYGRKLEEKYRETFPWISNTSYRQTGQDSWESYWEDGYDYETAFLEDLSHAD